MKTAVISGSMPPVQSGQTVVLYHLLKDLNPMDYCLITQKNAFITLFRSNSIEKLPSRCYTLYPDLEITRNILLNPISLRLSPILDAFLKIRAHQIKEILIKEKCSSVIVCTGDLFDPPAAFLASKSLKIPLIFYVFDDYIYQWTDPLMRKFAQKYEKCLVSSAADVIVPNECLSVEYRQRYGIKPTIIRNPVDIEQYEKMSQKHYKNFSEAKRIVYTGAIYDAHYSAFRNLIEAMIHIDQPDLMLHIFTNQFSEKLKKNGITGPVIIHKNLPNLCMPAVQRSANILFLPFTFEKNVRQIVNTSAPGKIGEYLAAKRPVLVHAPPDSFISWYFKKYNCGLVVDRDEIPLLAETVLRLLKDSNLREEITENAYLRAQTDFNIRDSQKKFSVYFDQ